MRKITLPGFGWCASKSESGSSTEVKPKKFVGAREIDLVREEIDYIAQETGLVKSKLMRHLGLGRFEFTRYFANDNQIPVSVIDKITTTLGVSKTALLKIKESRYKSALLVIEERVKANNLERHRTKNGA